MNIFFINEEPQVCADFLDDKRVVKMILENCQMLSTVLGGPYKPTHRNHPCTLWVGESYENAKWLIEYTHCLLQRYTRIYNKVHKCESLMPNFERQVNTHPFLNTEFTFPPNCTTLKDIDRVTQAYMAFMYLKWEYKDKREPTWNGEKYTKEYYAASSAFYHAKQLFQRKLVQSLSNLLVSFKLSDSHNKFIDVTKSPNLSRFSPYTRYFLKQFLGDSYEETNKYTV